VHMIIGIGTDLVLLEEFVISVNEQQNRYLERIFTAIEISDSQQRPDRFQFLAARLAVKEAFMKAIGTGWTDDVDWLHIETHNDADGKPHIELNGSTREIAQSQGIRRIHVSLSHTPLVASAFVVLESAIESPAERDPK